MMARSSSGESTTRVSKRKGTRSVSTLTPSQLARKRANDREAQRAIRARTKDHIDRLEQELDELRAGHRGSHSLDKTVQDLLRRNKSLEDELRRLKENVGITSSPYTSAYDDNLSTASGAMPSPRTSPFPSGEYTALPDYSQQYVPLPNNCETWASTVPNPVHSTVSSPSSSAQADDYSATYMPTSMPNAMLPSNATAAQKAIKMEYDSDDARFHMANPPVPNLTSAAYLQHEPQHQQQQQPWTMYPVYYTHQQIQSPVH